MTQTSTTGGRLLGLMALRAASKAVTEEATKERTEDAGQQGLDISTSSGGRGAATTRVAMRTMARAWGLRALVEAEVP
eukprot:scaffold12363_cov57-Phaeocystis_antarctica.AAC.2